MHGGFLAVVLSYDPLFCLKMCTAVRTRVLEITNLCCLSCVFSSGQHAFIVTLSGYIQCEEDTSPKKMSLQWHSTHFYSWILSPNFYSLSSICGFIKHHKLELSFTGKEDDLISMGLPLLHQITFPFLISRSTELWHWFSSQSRDIRSPVQLTSCILSGVWFFSIPRRINEKFF